MIMQRKPGPTRWTEIRNPFEVTTNPPRDGRCEPLEVCPFKEDILDNLHRHVEEGRCTEMVDVESYCG